MPHPSPGQTGSGSACRNSPSFRIIGSIWPADRLNNSAFSLPISLHDAGKTDGLARDQLALRVAPASP